MRVPLLIISLLILLASWCCATEPTKLDRHFVSGEFRIFFTTEGKSAVPKADRNESGVPDRVEDIAQQLSAVRRVFCDVLQFTNPIHCERYPDVNCIQVSIRHRSEFNIGNGTAYDESQQARRIPEGNQHDQAVVIAIGNHVDPTKNITPAHEYFHLIQYASTYFKNRWFLEGQARWSERALQTGGVGDARYPLIGPWPQNADQLRQLWMMSYDAQFVLWNPIARASDRIGLLPNSAITREIAATRYSNGHSVLADFDFVGAPIMREILVSLGKLDDVAFRELGYQEWTEQNQRSTMNNPYLYQAVMDVLRKHKRDVGRFPLP